VSEETGFPRRASVAPNVAAISSSVSTAAASAALPGDNISSTDDVGQSIDDERCQHQAVGRRQVLRIGTQQTDTQVYFQRHEFDISTFSYRP
jgi:hypothetical protein